MTDEELVALFKAKSNCGSCGNPLHGWSPDWDLCPFCGVKFIHVRPVPLAKSA